MLYSHTFIFFSHLVWKRTKWKQRDLCTNVFAEMVSKKNISRKNSQEKITKAVSKIFSNPKNRYVPKDDSPKIIRYAHFTYFFYSSRIVWTRTNKKTRLLKQRFILKLWKINWEKISNKKMSRMASKIFSNPKI